ncbi:MAG: DUF262 domain-containing HNH endonuclease family protein [Pseudomonadota bacterium]
MIDADFEADLQSYVEIQASTLQRLMGRGTRFNLPWAQRSYAWREEHMRRLCVDLAKAFYSPNKRYRLGFIRLARSNGDGVVSLVDGQQRLISLSLVFAFLIERLSPGKTRDALQSCLTRDGQPVVQVQPHMQAFFAERLTPGRHTADDDADMSALNWSEIRLLSNQQVIEPTLADCHISTDQLDDFGQFLLTRCIIIVETVASEAEALQILATEEDTGLPFVSAERAKVTLLSLLPRTDRDEASALWDRHQNQIGSEALSRVLGYIRTQALGESWDGRGTSPIETDLAKQFEIDQRGLVFLKHEFEPHARNFAALCQAEDADEASMLSDADWSEDVFAKVETLRWLDRDYWIAPALAFLKRHGTTHPEAAEFFRRLDYLAWIDRIGATSPDRSSKLFAALCSEIKEVTSFSRIKRLEPAPGTLKQARENLDSRTFYYKPWSHLILRRIGHQLGIDPGAKDDLHVTGEHILPRRPKKTSNWHRDFTQQGHPVGQYSDRIGNIAHLSRSDNQLCANGEWPFKRPILTESRFALSIDAARHDRWTPETISERSRHLISTFFESFER